MTHGYLYLCFYIAMQLKKCNKVSRGLHSISLSTQPRFYSCSFSFSPLGCYFFFLSSIFIYSEEDILPTA